MFDLSITHIHAKKIAKLTHITKNLIKANEAVKVTNKVKDFNFEYIEKNCDTICQGLASCQP